MEDNINMYYSMYRAVPKLRHSKQLISVTMTAHATEEQVTSAVTSRNNRRAAGSGVIYEVRVRATSSNNVIIVGRSIFSAVRADVL
jgi:hypothetical protein